MSPHPTFSIERSLPSLRVSKDFLISIEAYLRKRLIDAGVMSEEEAQSALSLKIDDSLGSEQLSSISQFDAAQFSDSTRRIIVELDSRYRDDGTKLRVRLSFSKGRISSTMAISTTMPNAREIAIGLGEGIARVMEPHETSHWLFHPSAPVWGVAIGAGIIAAVPLIFWNANHKSFYLVAALALGWIYLAVLGPLQPYIVFDSRAADRLDNIRKWLWQGLATFIVFGTLFVLVRRQLIGF